MPTRPFDDQSQERIRLETEAVILILSRFQKGDWEQIGSEVLDFEIAQTPDLERRARVKLLAKAVHRSVPLEKEAVERAHDLAAIGFHPIDALHLACAEQGGADIFLTTDDRIIRLAARLSVQVRVRVKNPLTWLNEVIEG